MIIREATLDDGGAIARIAVDTWRAAYRGLLPAEYLAGLSYEKREKGVRELLSHPEGKYFYLVCETEPGHMVGFVAGGPEREGNSVYKGEIYAIYVLPAYQGQGIGRLLFQAAVERLKQAKLQSLLVGVLAENPCRRFYKSLGGVRVNSNMVTFDGLTFKMAYYGWKEL